MLATMADEKKKKKQRGRPKGRRETIVVQARVSPEMHAALEQLAEQTRRSKNTELIIALENHLRAASLWPPQEAAE